MAWASTLLVLQDSPYDAPLAKAFDAAGLDPVNPIHWRILISFFAMAHFGQGKGRGRPAEWDGERYSKLLQDVDRV